MKMRARKIICRIALLNLFYECANGNNSKHYNGEYCVVQNLNLLTLNSIDA